MLESLLSAAEHLGSRHFYKNLLELGGNKVAADSAQVLYFGPSSSPEYLCAVHTPSATRELYQSHFFNHCPMSHYWRQARQASVVPVREARQPNTDYGDYFDVFYRSNGVRDDIGMFLPVGAEQAVGLFFERGSSFSQREIRRVKNLLPSVLRLHKTHVRLVLNELLAQYRCSTGQRHVTLYDRDGNPVLASDERLEISLHPAVPSTQLERLDLRQMPQELRQGAELIGPLPPQFPLAPGGYLRIGSASSDPHRHSRRIERLRRITLSQRERDTLELILRGCCVKDIATALEVSVNTVKVHRRRLFQRLGIHSERELFLLLLNHHDGLNNDNTLLH